MQTLKTAVVVVLLLALLYGVYVVLSKPDAREAASHLARELVNSGPQSEDAAADADPWSHSPIATDTGSPSNAPGTPSDAWGTPPDAWGTPAGPSRTARGSGPSDPGLDRFERPGASPTELESDRFPGSRQSPGGPANPDALRENAIGPVGSDSRSGSESSSAQPPGVHDHDRHDGGRDIGPSRPVGADGQAPGDQGISPLAAGDRGTAPGNLGGPAFSRAMRTAQNHIAQAEYREALETLSMFYNSPDLSADQHSQLLDLLDPLAGKVIYSTEHHLESAYEVRRDETLQEIAGRYQVPWQLLGNINSVREPKVLVPGTLLKVVPGPFRAEVDMARGELTLFLGRMYAGRFPVTFGADPPPQAGRFEVREKLTDRAYFGANGQTLAADDPRNPYGGVWLDLGRNLCLHGSPRDRFPGSERMGCISLSPRDARDVLGILSTGSQVLVRR